MAISAYRGYSIIGLAIEVKDDLDPEIYEVLIHGSDDYRYPQTNDAADEVLDLLEQIKAARQRREAAGTTREESTRVGSTLVS